MEPTQFINLIDLTALINHLRALLLERGIIAPKGRRQLEAQLEVFADEDDARLSQRIRLLVEDLRAEWRALDARIAAFDAELVAMARDDATARLLTTIPGIGAINATALAAALGDARSFGRGRGVAAWLGLTPRQASTGGNTRRLWIALDANAASFASRTSSRRRRRTSARSPAAAAPRLRDPSQ